MNSRKLRLSRWCKYFTRNDITAFYHSILLNVIFIPTEIAVKIVDIFKQPKKLEEALSVVGKELLMALRDQKLLVDNGSNEFDVLLRVREELKTDITLESMYLLLTDGCDFCCGYCFEETPVGKKIFKPLLMSSDIAKAAIDLFAELIQKYGNAEKKKIIHLYGGEPLLNMGVVEFVISYIREMKTQKKLPDKCDIVIVTNGSQINDAAAKIFFANGITVGISLDGPLQINDLYRFSKNGKSAFEIAVNAYNLLRKTGVIVGLSATLTPATVDNFDSVLDFFTNDLKIQDGISFNILHYNPAVPVDINYFRKAAECIIKAFERFRTMGIYEERMMRKAKAFITKSQIFADCSVVGSQIVISPDGKIGACQDFIKPRTYFKGSVLEKNYDPFKNGLFVDWEKRSPFFMEQCLDCEAIGICGGGCPASVELKTGNRWNIDERICPHSKLTLEWLIWETFAKMRKNV